MLKKISKFSVEKQFCEYVARGFKGKTPEQLPKTQELELRRCFYMAWAQCLFVIRDDVSVFPEPAAVVILEGMVKEIDRYLQKDLANHNPN